jgi:hypothetical protein
LWRQIGRRGYASGGHESTKAGGDAVWAAGAIAVTVPTCWYLLQNAPEPAHGHEGHSDDRSKAHDEESKDEGEEKSDDGEEKEEFKDVDKDIGKSENSDSDDESKDLDTSDDEGKGETKESKTGDTRKHIPDAKGGAKKRIESEKGMNQDERVQQSGDEESKDKPAASKPAGSQSLQLGKQEGLSNTNSKHSTDIANNPEKSTKGEGTPETAKSKGTVDPKPPQV